MINTTNPGYQWASVGVNKLTLLGIALALAGCGKPAARPPEKSLVRTAAVQPMSDVGSNGDASYLAQVKFEHETDLSFKVGGIVVSIGPAIGTDWDEATPVFQQQEPKAKFIQLQLEHLAALGGYRRIIAVTEAKLMIGGTSATFDALAEFEKASGVRTVFAFYHRSRSDPWRLRSFKVVLPMPRAADDGARAELLPGSAAPGPLVPPTIAAPPAPVSAPPHLAPRDAGPR